MAVSAPRISVPATTAPIAPERLAQPTSSTGSAHWSSTLARALR
jgi:hypothetical protein